MKKRIIVICITVNVLLVLATFILVFKTNQKKPIVLENYSSYSLDTVLDKLDKFDVEIVYLDSSKTKDSVLYTNPKANTLVLENQVITVFVANGNSDVEYINFTGKLLEEQETYLKMLEEKFNVEVVIENVVSNDFADGVIIYQSKTGKIEFGDKLVLTINYIKPLLEIIDFSNFTEEEVIDYFFGKDIKLVFIYLSEFTSESRVISQSIKPNSLVLDTQTTLTLYLDD